MESVSQLAKMGLIRLIYVTTKVTVNGLTNVTTVNDTFFMS